MRHPIYARSIVSVTSSILKHYGVPARHATLPECDARLALNPRNVLLLLCDGMGMQMLRDHLRPDGLLRAHLAAQLTSVFPSTTAAALTSVESGLTPAEHAWLGWSVYFPELGANVDVFPNTLSDSDARVQAADYHVARRFQPMTRVPELLEGVPDLTAEYLCPFNHNPTRGLGDLLLRAEARFREPGRHFVFGYYNEPDHAAHEMGVRHAMTAAAVRDIELVLEAYMRLRQPDTQVFVIADHGLVDVKTLYITDHPDLADTFERPPCVEQRAAAFKIKPGRALEFERLFMRAFGHEGFMLYAARDIPVRRLFGGGALNPRVKDILGDYFCVSAGDKCLAWKPRRDGSCFAAAHAGVTAPEMRVPLIAL